MTHQLSSTPLLSRQVIRSRVKTLARQIRQHYGEEDVLWVGLMNGAFIFLADLARQFPQPIELAFLRAASYGKKARSSGQVELDGLEKLDLVGRKVLLIDDILDTGRTMSYVSAALLEAGASDVQSCVLLDKEARREVPFQASFKGFVIEDLFVVGYGLDYAEKYRNLPEVWTVKELA